MKNIRFGLCIPAFLFALFCTQQASPQGYVKLNVPYALVGVVNPAVEFAISPKSTLQTDIVISPWKSINEKHMLFAIFMGEYRRYFKEHNRGWYLGANIGMMAFDMSKPYIEGWKLKFEDRYCKGYGMMIGLCVGYEYQFGKRWLLDAFLGWAWMDSHYNGYSFDGQVDMYPTAPYSPNTPTRSTALRSGIPTRSASRSGIASSRLATNSGQRTCAKQHLRTAAGRPRKVRNSGTMGSGTPGMRTTGNSGRPGNLNPGGKLHPSPSEPHPRQARTVRQTATRNRGRQQPAPRETAPEPFRGYGIPLPSQHTQCRK